MKQILTLALVIGVIITCECSAEEGGKGKGGNRKPSAAGQRRPGDPTQMATRMISQFDKDGDQKLDSTELAAMFTAMRERRAAGGQRGKGQGQRPGAGRRGKGRGEDGAAGGAAPKRPAAE